jgi:hypothetical protein
MLFAAEYDIPIPDWFPLAIVAVLVLLVVCGSGLVLWLMSRRPK